MDLAMIGNNDVTSHRISDKHPALPGHFPNRPIVPAVVILSTLFNELADKYPKWQLCGIKKLKFLYPLQANQAFTVSFDDIKNNGLRFKCWVEDPTPMPIEAATPSTLMAEGHLKLKPARV